MGERAIKTENKSMNSGGVLQQKILCEKRGDNYVALLLVAIIFELMHLISRNHNYNLK